MAEMRLTCPGCGAEYRLDAAAIPARGREVECSACDRVWHQAAPPVSRAAPRDPLVQATARAHAGRGEGAAAPGRDGGAKGPVRTIPVPPPLAAPGEGRDDAPAAGAADPAAAPPRLNRPLPPDVLAILTEEASRERALRAGGSAPGAGTDATPAPPPASTPAPPLASPLDPGPDARTGHAVDARPDSRPETEWPATTLSILPAAALSPPAAGEARPPSPIPPPMAAPREAAVPVARPLVADPALRDPRPDPAPRDPAPRAPAVPPAAPAPRRTAFWWGLALPLLVLGLYLLADGLPPDHPLTQALAPLREALDRARLWLAGLAG